MIEIIKVAALAISVVYLISILKSAGSQLHIVLIMTFSVLVIYILSGRISGIIAQLTRMQAIVNYGQDYIALLIKIIGITYVTQFASDLCKDSGYNALAGQIELFCKITIAAISFPVICSLFDMTLMTVSAATTEIEDLDFSEIDRILENSNYNGFSFKNIVKDICNNDFEAQGLLRQAIQSIFNEIISNQSYILNILFLAVFSASLKILLPDNNKQVSDISLFIVYAIMIITIYSIFKSAVSISYKAINSTVDLYMAIIPILLPLIAAVTGSISSGVYYEVVVMMVTAVNVVFKDILINVVRATYMISMVNILTEGGRFTKLGEILTRAVKFCCKLVLTVFSGLSCVKTILGQSTDAVKKNLFYKSAKLIPAVGDSIEAVSQTVVSAGNVIKNAVGIAGILVLIITVSAPLLQLISITCMLKILAAVIEPLADKQFISIIDTSGNILGLLCLIVTVQCSLFIMVTAVMICLLKP